MPLISNATLRKGAYSVVDQGVVSATSFLTGWVIARACSKTDLGIYCLALTIMLFLRCIHDQVISSPYLVYSSRRRGADLASYSGSSFVHHAAFSAGALVCLLLVSGGLTLGIVADLGNAAWLASAASLRSAVWVLLAALPFVLLREYLRAVAFARLEPGVAVVLDVLAATLQLGGLVTLYHYGLLAVPAVYAVMGGACAAACLVGLLARRQPLRFLPARILPDWRHNWSFAKWTFASQLVGSATPYLLPWILALADEPAATGVFFAASTLTGIAYVFVTGMGNFLVPKAARAFAGGGVRPLGRVLAAAVLLNAAVLGTVCLAIVATGDLLPVAVYGSRFAGVGPVLAVLCLASLAMGLGAVAGYGLLAMERPAANFRADICAQGTMLGVAACTVGPWGAWGAAVATAAGALVGASIRWLTLWQLMSHGARAARFSAPATPPCGLGPDCDEPACSLGEA